jgi:hypothetical protein
MPDNQKNAPRGNDKPGGGSQVPNPGGQQGRNIAGDDNNANPSPKEPEKEQSPP